MNTKYIISYVFFILLIICGCKEDILGGWTYQWEVYSISDTEDVGVHIINKDDLYIELRADNAELTISSANYDIWRIGIENNNSWLESDIGFTREWGSVTIDVNKIIFKFENFTKQLMDDDIHMYVWTGDAHANITIHRVAD